MYLTFRRDNLESASASDQLSFESNIDLEGIVYYNDRIIIENTPDVEFVETYFDEIIQTDEIVPDQLKLEEYKKDLVDLDEKEDHYL